MKLNNEKSLSLCWYPLGIEAINHFNSQGYLIMRNVLDQPAIDQLIQAGDWLINSKKRKNRQLSQIKRYDSFRNCITLDEIFIPLLTHHKILSAVVQLLGAHLQLMTSQLIYKSPDPQQTLVTARSPGWHRDYASATKILGNLVPRILLKCAFYLTDLSAPNSGATMIAPGSNHLLDNIVIPTGDADPVGAIEPSLQAGDCLLFENRTWHAAAANLSDRTRKVVIFGYGYRWVMPMDYRTQQVSFLAKLNQLEKYLVGEPYQKTPEYRPGGGDSPLADWCEQYGSPSIIPV